MALSERYMTLVNDIADEGPVRDAAVGWLEGRLDEERLDETAEDDLRTEIACFVDGYTALPPDREIPNTDEIGAFMHCGLCLEEKPDGVSPQEWARLEFGSTPLGFQLRCTRHGVNVCHIDMGGRKVKANNTRPRDGARP